MPREASASISQESPARDYTGLTQACYLPSHYTLQTENLLPGNLSIALPGPRTTRSKKVFSPWEIYDIGVKNPLFTLEDLLEAKSRRTPDSPTECDDNGGIAPEDSSPTPDNDIPAGPSINMSPPPSPAPSCSRAESPIQSVGLLNKKERRRQRRNAVSHKARAQKRANPEYGSTIPRKLIQERYQDADETLSVPMLLEGCKASGYTGPRDTDRSTAPHPLSYFVGEGSKMGFTLERWDGRTPTALIDGNGRLVGILAGHPNDPQWPSLVLQAGQAMEEARLQINAKDNQAGRRGRFTTIQCGISHGGGQKKPANMLNNAAEKKALDKLNSLPFFKRVSSFSTSVIATRAPKLHAHYAKTMGKLYKHDTKLQRPFPASILSGTTYNLGPRTVCRKHHDGGNYSTGMCAITPTGSYDYRLGGHLVLWECRLVVQFPPGSTILIPSALIAHSNTSIQPHETRYSFTQYTAGALFRWVENGFQSAAAYRQSLGLEENEKTKAKDANRWEEALSMLPNVSLRTVPVE